MKTNELRQKLLERWTGITAVIPRRPPSLHIGDHGEWLMKWAALFKGKDGSRMHLQKPSELCQLLYAEHGSVTGDTWLEYLEHILPQVDNPAEAIVPVTDWYAPHFSPEAKDFAERKVLSPTLMIGGGCTDTVAVCDNKPHRHIAQRYKELEQHARVQQLSLRPSKVPRTTRSRASCSTSSISGGLISPS